VTSTETSRNRIRVFPLSPSLVFFNRDRKNQHTSSARERERVHETTRLLISLTRRTRKTEEDEQRERERERLLKTKVKKSTHCVRVIGPLALGSIANGLPPKLPLALCGTFLRDSYSRATSASYCGSTPRGTTPGPMDAECDVREGSIFFYVVCMRALVRCSRSSRRNEERNALWRVKP
jgi:hypothetical protein